MHFLARWLKGTVAVAEELAKDEYLLQQEMQQFMQSYMIKERVLERLLQGEPIYGFLMNLQYALKEELQIIEQTTHTEHEIFQDLKYLSREHYIRRLEDVSREMSSAESRDSYLRHILSELHDTLMAEARKTQRLLHGEHDPDLTNALIDLLTIERHLVEKLHAIADFRNLFGDVYYGTKRKDTIDKYKKRLYEQVRRCMTSVEPSASGMITPTEEHYLCHLTARVMNKLQDAVMDAVRKGYIREHRHVDVEYVNSPLFEQFILAEMSMDKRLNRLVPSQRTMEAFVHVFREMYNTPEVNA